MWTRLTECFPETVSAVLMPNHLHLILPNKRNSHSRVAHTLGGLLGSLTKRMEKQALWLPIPPPSVIPDKMHLKRQIRYLALNPCRKNLSSDPLVWYWSTYREIVGASVESQNRAEKVSELINESRRNFLVRFHAYVSGDPSVDVEGTPLPKRAESRGISFHSLGEILEASAAALRVLPDDIQKNSPLRSLFIHMAYRYEWRRPTLLGQICGLSRGGVHRVLTLTPPIGIEAAELCLGDFRLIHHPGQPKTNLSGLRTSPSYSNTSPHGA